VNHRTFTHAADDPEPLYNGQYLTPEQYAVRESAAPYFLPQPLCGGCGNALYTTGGHGQPISVCCENELCSEQGRNYEINPIAAPSIRQSRARGPLRERHAAPQHAPIVQGSIAWRQTTTCSVEPLEALGTLHRRIA
jgi:hypothetical protein